MVNTNIFTSKRRIASLAILLILLFCSIGMYVYQERYNTSENTSSEKAGSDDAYNANNSNVHFSSVSATDSGKNTLLVIQEREGERRLVITDEEGVILHKISHDEFVISASWSPDKEYIVYTSIPTMPKDPSERQTISVHLSASDGSLNIVLYLAEEKQMKATINNDNSYVALTTPTKLLITDTENNAQPEVLYEYPEHWEGSTDVLFVPEAFWDGENILLSVFNEKGEKETKAFVVN